MRAIRAMLMVAGLGLVYGMTSWTGTAAEPSDLLYQVHRWTEASFAKAIALPPPANIPNTDRLEILQRSHKVLQNRTVWNRPLTLGGKTYEHGLYMDAPATVRVCLSRPAVELTSLVGIDDNDDTKQHPQAGSARFHVIVEGRQVFSTPVLRLGDGPKPVRVPLGGVREFLLTVDDGGDGRGWDQCVWAEAVVKLDDGTSRRLGDLAQIEPLANRSNVPFFFRYGGQSSDELLPGWDFTEQNIKAEQGSQRLISYRCPKTGLRIECLVTTYPDIPAVDWLCWLVNEGPTDTPIIENFLPLDARLPVPGAGANVQLRWSQGDSCSADSFLPHDELLEKNQPRLFSAVSSDTTCLPFFNLAGAEGGWILAVGWSGRWKVEFQRETNEQVRVRAGMVATHFRLHPGERVRSPRIVLLRYAGPMIAGHNQFRRMMFRYYVPRLDGVPIQPPVAYTSVAALHLKAKRTGQPLGRMTEASELALLDRASKLGCEVYWMDAYWFPQPWGTNCGNWYPRPDDFPRGLRPLAEAAHQRGMKFLLWFAPILVHKGTEWAKQYPQFVHAVSETGTWKLGDPKAREFLVDWLSQKKAEWDFDIYREDLGLGTVPEEGPDRIGIAEMKHIEGFYWVWTELLRRNPGLVIDNCCAGGRRIDMETARLAYVLWRSDFNDVGEGLKDQEYWPRMGRADQVMVTGLSLYFPLHAGPVWDMRPYCFRSAMSSGIALYTDIESKEFSEEQARQAIAELKQLRPLWQGDFYPLMPLTLRQADWYAYQLDRPDLGEGCAVVFRRPEAADSTRTIQLQQIDPNGVYLVSLTGETYIQAPARKMMGSELATLTITIPSQPGSALLRYKRLSP